MSKSDIELTQEIVSLERMFRKSERVLVTMTPPMKRAIQTVAQLNHISMADLLREAVTRHMNTMYPEYVKLYHKLMLEEVEAMQAQKNEQLKNLVGTE